MTPPGLAGAFTSGRRQPQLELPLGYRLRPWTTADAPDIVIGMRDALVRQYAGQLIDDRQSALAALHAWADQWQEGLGAAWAIWDPGQQILGSVRFGVIDPEVGTGSVGYWLLPEGRGRGLAANALRAATEFVFEHFGWYRVELYHAVENERSCGVAKRAGYRPEGVMRSAMRYPIDGRRSDEHLHARLVTDPPSN
jgi:RimJ/RimL family protein N-acetyltransferase